MRDLNAYNNKARAGEQGSALVYILIAIALLAALTVTFMEPSSQQTSSQGSFKAISSIEAQIDSIRSAIQECVLTYPAGDSLIDNGVGGDDEGARDNYPINPNSNYYSANAAPYDQSGDRLVKNIRCPGNNGGVGNESKHEKIFSSSAGRFMPTAPALFNDWQYYNGNDGVFFWIETDKTDAFLVSALDKLDTKFATCETDVIDATSAAKDLDSDATLTCPSGSVCFRVWMFSKATAVFNGDTTDTSEATCP